MEVGQHVSADALLPVPEVLGALLVTQREAYSLAATKAALERVADSAAIRDASHLHFTGAYVGLVLGEPVSGQTTVVVRGLHSVDLSRQLVHVDGGSEAHPLAAVLPGPPTTQQWREACRELAGRLLRGEAEHVTAAELRSVCERLAVLQRCAAELPAPGQPVDAARRKALEAVLAACEMDEPTWELWCRNLRKWRWDAERAAELAATGGLFEPGSGPSNESRVPRRPCEQQQCSVPAAQGRQEASNAATAASDTGAAKRMRVAGGGMAGKGWTWEPPAKLRRIVTSGPHNAGGTSSASAGAVNLVQKALPLSGAYVAVKPPWLDKLRAAAGSASPTAAAREGPSSSADAAFMAARSETAPWEPGPRPSSAGYITAPEPSSVVVDAWARRVHLLLLAQPDRAMRWKDVASRPGLEPPSHVQLDGRTAPTFLQTFGHLWRVSGSQWSEIMLVAAPPPPRLSSPPPQPPPWLAHLQQTSPAAPGAPDKSHPKSRQPSSTVQSGQRQPALSGVAPKQPQAQSKGAGGGGACPESGKAGTKPRPSDPCLEAWAEAVYRHLLTQPDHTAEARSLPKLGLGLPAGLQTNLKLNHVLSGQSFRNLWALWAPGPGRPLSVTALPGALEPWLAARRKQGRKRQPKQAAGGPKPAPATTLAEAGCGGPGPDRPESAGGRGLGAGTAEAAGAEAGAEEVEEGEAQPPPHAEHWSSDEEGEARSPHAWPRALDGDTGEAGVEEEEEEEGEARSTPGSEEQAGPPARGTHQRAPAHLAKQPRGSADLNELNVV
ncbi:hypothetical protein HYH03_004757 [Edaphochlamys debaryana]|uniref:Uncharacterized protein n=1 Tax=Edaphochlamys debaryana TaxID=47281 RepID=A0A835Y8W8_9CHLO|nr:hypothetical protein HYH03_004757 [Edaphochlamys debaryana]|eukprot:KAG2497167.1 hypothetical protein HYH03_004757 [Edaphochlamys debaryana]